MNLHDQNELLERFFKERRELMNQKGQDYANTDDVLDNFKRTAAILNSTPEAQVLNLIAVKVARISNLLNAKPNFESVSDSVTDLANYTDLMYCVLMEKEKENINNNLNF